MLEPSTLLTGGIIAAVAGFWSQVKNILRQVSALVVVQARVDSGLVYPLRTHLKRTYIPVPSGLRYYTERMYRVVGFSRWVTVPFRMADGPIIYRKGWHFVIASSGFSKLWTVRGFCNLDTLIGDSLDAYERYLDESRNDRFTINTIVGMEKGAWAGGMSKGKGEESPVQNSSGTISMESPVVDIEDSSFKYPKTFYEATPDSDPFDRLFFNDDVKTHIDKAKHWLQMRDWYAERMIPWRRGWILHGPGGTGKSSLARAIAQKLKIPIYDFRLNTLSDQEFLREWSTMATPCMVLFEDFDNVFDGREALTEHRSLSFDTILNAISGVNSFSGVFLLVTTNHLNKIDPAMGVSTTLDNGVSTRPGRIDTVIHLGYMSEDNRRRMAQGILKDWPDLVEQVVKGAESVTPAQFQEICVQEAFNRIDI